MYFLNRILSRDDVSRNKLCQYFFDFGLSQAGHREDRGTRKKPDPREAVEASRTLGYAGVFMRSVSLLFCKGAKPGFTSASAIQLRRRFRAPLPASAPVSGPLRRATVEHPRRNRDLELTPFPLCSYLRL